jgi:hypothetical protein
LASAIRLPGALLKRGRGQPGVDCPQCPWPFARLGRWLPWPLLVYASDARGVGAIGSLPTPRSNPAPNAHAPVLGMRAAWLARPPRRLPWRGRLG